MVPDPLALDVVVQPAAQPRPGPGERFVGDLEHPFVAGHQPGADQLLDQLLVGGSEAIRRRGTWARTASPPMPGETSRSIRSRSWRRWSGSICP